MARRWRWATRPRCRRPGDRERHLRHPERQRGVEHARRSTVPGRVARRWRPQRECGCGHRRVRPSECGGNLAVVAAQALRITDSSYTDAAFDVRAGNLHNVGTLYGLGGGNVTTAGLLETTAASTLHAGGALAIDAGTAQQQRHCRCRRCPDALATATPT